MKFDFSSIANASEKSPVLLKNPVIALVSGTKKDLAEEIPQGQFFYCAFVNGLCPKTVYAFYFSALIAACAAASLAIGTRKGEQET